MEPDEDRVPPRANTIRIAPPLIVSKQQIDELVGTLGDALRELGRSF